MSNTHTVDAPHQDNLFGICAALGDDFGFNPLWLRLALATAFLFRPELVVAGYFAIGIVVLLTRLAYPKTTSARPGLRLAPAAAPQESEERIQEEEVIELARAA